MLSFESNPEHPQLPSTSTVVEATYRPSALVSCAHRTYGYRTILWVSTAQKLFGFREMLIAQFIAASKNNANILDDNTERVKSALGFLIILAGRVKLQGYTCGQNV